MYFSISLFTLDCQFRFDNFVDDACLVNLVPADGGSWTRTACVDLEMLEEVDMMVHVEMVGMSGSGTLRVILWRMFLKIMDGDDFQSVPVGAKLDQLGLAISTEEGMLDNMDKGRVGFSVMFMFTVEVVMVEDMRKDHFMTEIPIQRFPLFHHNENSQK